MSITVYILLFFSAFIGSVINAIAGGGSFFTFPALIFAGVPILNANATSTVALWPGAVSSAFTYRKKLQIDKKKLITFAIISLVGSIAGTVLLLITPSDILKKILPYLMLIATLLLAFKKQLAGNKTIGTASANNAAFINILQFIIAVYGGYFGGGIGILMLAAFHLMGFTDLLQMNALKTVLAALINGAAVVLFTVTQQVIWPVAVVMLVGGIIGGYTGAFIGSKISAVLLNRFIIAVGIFLTIWFFTHQ
jgi:hypothetical protein